MVERVQIESHFSQHLASFSIRRVCKELLLTQNLSYFLTPCSGLFIFKCNNLLIVFPCFCLLSIPLGAGQFDRGLYLEGIRRRITRELKRREAMKNQSSSSTICTIS